MRPLAFVLVAACAGPVLPAPTYPPLAPEAEVEATGDSTSSCSVWMREGLIEWTLDSKGRPVARYENSDAAGAQWASSWERDAQGRAVRIETEMLEGMGAETGDGDERRELSYRRGADGSTVASYQRDGETHQVRWVYDDHGRPARREYSIDDEQPRVTTCEYDARGRVVAKDDWRYGYRGERAVPSWVHPPEGPAVPFVAFGQTLFMADLDDPYTHPSEIRYEGDCIDVFFEPCSPVFAPPIPGRPLSRLPAPSDEPLPTMEAVVVQHLGCGPADDPEDRCTIEGVERAETTAEGDLREVALVTIARGSSGSESTHLLMRVTGGWWLGPQLADGPFDGDQTVGTLSFGVSEVSLRPVDPEEGPALLARYETETVNEVDGAERAVTESGWIVCLALADPQLRCARVAEHIEERIDGEATTASARLTFVGDGTIGVDQVSGSNDRVPDESFPIDWLFP